jgi:hypothetical protein
MTSSWIVTCGREEEGGSSAVVQYLLQDVQHVYSTVDAFAEVTSAGRVVTWGQHGGLGAYSPSPSAPFLASGVRAIASTIYAFAAIKTGGQVVAWGDALFGGDASMVQAQLNSGVVDVFATITAFAAPLSNTGSVVTWEDARFGGSSQSVQMQLVSEVRGLEQRTVAETPPLVCTSAVIRLTLWM